MVRAQAERLAAGGSGGAVPRFFLRTRDPDQLTEALAPIAPGSRLEAVSRRGFTANLRAWRFQRTGLLSLQMEEGRAFLPGCRDYACLTVASAGTLRADDGRRYLEIEGDAAHFLDASEPTEFRPSERSRVLAANVDGSLLAAHTSRPMARRGGSDARCATLIAASTERSSLRRFFDWVFAELNRAGSSLHDPRIATEVESVLAAMLAEACSAPDVLPALPGDDSLRRAEEFLAASLSKPVSLAEVAAVSGVSVRTLSRGFRERHGVGPIGFLHQRRLEAARRELIAAVPDEATVTEVAHRYCFAHTGRFAIAYRRAFGELPSETLRR
jgi:AraC-like DNA-binding protein